jgi:hypothetical protein
MLQTATRAQPHVFVDNHELEVIARRTMEEARGDSIRIRARKAAVKVPEARRSLWQSLEDLTRPRLPAERSRL